MFLFEAEISTARLTALCNRLSTAVNAGLDLRAVWAQEALRAPAGPVRRRIQAVADAVHQGASMREALDQAGNYFPLLFREMVQAGDEAGRLGEMLAELARQYEHRQQLRRGFLIALAWPMFQLAATVVIIGVLILALGIIGEMTNTEVDILGWGLTGVRGLIIYLMCIGIIATAAFLAYRAIKKSLVVSGQVQQLILKIPVIGGMVNNTAVSRIAWALSMTLNSGMEVRRAIGLSLRSCGNARYINAIPTIDRWIEQGGSLYEAMLQADVFPSDFMDAIHTGEAAGAVPEIMRKVAEDYQSKAKTSAHIASIIGYFVIFGVIAAVIVSLVLTIFIRGYLAPINEALDAANGGF